MEYLEAAERLLGKVNLLVVAAVKDDTEPAVTSTMVDVATQTATIANSYLLMDIAQSLRTLVANDNEFKESLAYRRFKKEKS